MKRTRRILSVSLLVCLVSQCMLGLTSCNDECQNAEWSEWTVTTEPTCTEAGVRTRTCKGCAVTETEPIAALSHSFTKYAHDHNATCLANMTETATCDRCQVTDTREVANSKNASAHVTDEVQYRKNATDATKHDAVYACCGAVIGSQVHTWDTGVLDGDVTVYTCTLCKTTNRVASAGHTHDAGFVAAKTASCTENGNVAYWYCEGCRTYFADEALTQQLTQAETVIAADHESTEFTYAVNSTDATKHDKKHACCGTVVETVAHAFEFHQNLIAKCEQAGGEEYKCVCGETKIENETSATGHSVEFWDFVNETPKTAADCTFVQTYGGTCFTCNTLQTKTVEIVRHRFVATVTLSPTCQSAGTKSYECACGAKPATPNVTIPAIPDAHDWDDGVTEGGVTTYSCLTQGCLATKTSLVYASSSQTVNASDLADNDLVLDGVSLRLDSTTLALLDGEVDIGAAPVADRDAVIASIPEALRGQITTDTPIYDFSLSQNGQAISSFNGGSITITIPYALPAGADADCVAVWYVADNGTVSFYQATYYEVNGEGFVTFEADHFSTYLPGLAPEEDACELYEHNETSSIVAPTCTEAGYTEYHCQRCGDSRMADTVSPLGHAYDAGVSTEATCSAPGTTTYSCTRIDCDHQMVTALTVPHDYRYDKAASDPATCTKDGYAIYKCAADGCDAQRREEQTAYGQHDWEIRGVALATGANKCTDGVVLSKKCMICEETETETIYEHTPYDKYTDEQGNYLIPGQTTIGLGEYLTQAGIQYMEEPVITITHGCLCGEQKSEIRISNGMSMNGMELFMGWFDGFTWHSAPQNLAECDTVLMETQSEMVGYDPATGPIFSEPFKVQFREILTVDGCHYTYSIEIKIGYDEATGDALRTETYVLAEFDSHSIQTTATVKDPSKSCYENCRDGNNPWKPGITVIDTCTKCGEVIRTYEDGVTSDSSHYWYNAEVYTYRDSDCSDTYYGVRVFIKACPCGKGDYTLHKGDCSFTRVATGDYTVYQCGDCGYIYAERTVTLEDKENCRYTVTKYLYLGCDSEMNPTNCEKTVVCVTTDYEMHYETEARNRTEATEYSCTSAYRDATVCKACGHEIRVYEGYRQNHDLNTTEVTDSHGNVTKTESCKAAGCDYLHITVTDKDGNRLREYTVDKDYKRSEKSVILYTWKMIWGEIRPVTERSENYDLVSGALLRWYQSNYTYQIVPEKACVAVITSTNHEGETNQYGQPCCEFGDEEYQERTCLQDGYSRRTCKRCGAVEYNWYEEGRHQFDISTSMPTLNGGWVYYSSCWNCGICVTDGMSPYPLNVSGSYDGTIRYRNSEASTATGIDATVSFKVYAVDMYSGAIVDDKDTHEIYTFTLEGITVTDDGQGTLTFSPEDVRTALENKTLNEEYQYYVCLVIEADGQSPIYIQIQY